jgi:hypothetical protein
MTLSETRIIRSLSLSLTLYNIQQHLPHGAPAHSAIQLIQHLTHTHVEVILLFQIIIIINTQTHIHSQMHGIYMYIYSNRQTMFMIYHIKQIYMYEERERD